MDLEKFKDSLEICVLTSIFLYIFTSGKSQCLNFFISIGFNRGIHKDVLKTRNINIGRTDEAILKRIAS